MRKSRRALHVSNRGTERQASTRRLRISKDRLGAVLRILLQVLQHRLRLPHAVRSCATKCATFCASCGVQVEGSCEIRESIVITETSLLASLQTLRSFAIIRMLHADRLGLGFALERSLQIHVQLAIEHLFCLAECEGWTASESLAKSWVVVAKLGWVRPDCKGRFVQLRWRYEISGEKHFRRFRQSYYARQQVGRGHVSSRQSNLHKQKRNFAFFARDANV